MTVTIPSSLPQLHRGAHGADSGRACIMNAIAYMNGDKEISDMPGCVYPPFALMAQSINDNICRHSACAICTEAHETGKLIDSHNCIYPLCGSCAHKVWMMGVQLIGTAELAYRLTWSERRDVAIQIGAALVDWDAERCALRRHAETDSGIRFGGPSVSPAFWQAALDAMEDALAGRRPWEKRLSLLQISRLEEAGGTGLANMILLIQAPSQPLRDSVLSNMGKRYANSQAWTPEDSWNIAFGYEELGVKLSELVGILRRAAGHAAQADVVLTEEDMAKVPVGVA